MDLKAGTFTDLVEQHVPVTVRKPNPHVLVERLLNAAMHLGTDRRV
jgi:hypothetical protein